MLSRLDLQIPQKTGAARHYRASVLDRRTAGHVIAVAVGPVAATDTEHFLPKLRAMAALGPEQRIGIVPDARSSRWRVVEPDESWITTDPEFDPEDLAGAVLRLAQGPSDAPIKVGLAGGYILLRADHGVGDGQALFELIAAMSEPGPARPTGFIPPLPVSNTRFPLAAVLAREFRHEFRAQVRDVLAWLRSRGSAGAHGDPATPAHTTPAETPAPSGPGRPAMAFARTEPGYLDALRAARRADPTSPTVGSLVAFALADAFRAAEPRLAPRMGVLVGLRRLLPPGRGTSANLATLADVPISADRTEFVRAFTSAAASKAGPIRLALSLAVSRIRGVPLVPPPVGGPITLTLSNLSQHPEPRKIVWADGPADDRAIAIALPAVGRQQIALALSQVGSEFQVVAAYDAAVVPTATVEGALRDAMRTSRWDIT